MSLFSDFLQNTQGFSVKTIRITANDITESYRYSLRYTFENRPKISACFRLTVNLLSGSIKLQSGSVQGERMNPARVGRQQRYSCASVPRSAWLRCLFFFFFNVETIVFMTSEKTPRFLESEIALSHISDKFFGTL